MNYGQVRDQILKFLNQYTVAGAKVEHSYNNQQDYLERIPGLVNDAMTEIATTAKKIPVLLDLKDLPCEDLGRQLRYELPEDFFQLKSGCVMRRSDGMYISTNWFAVVDNKYLLVLKEVPGEFSIVYYRYPKLLSDKPKDSDPLDNAPETHYAVACYAAAHLLAHDDLSLSAMYHNAYEDKLAKMWAGPTMEVQQVRDAYHFFG